MSDPGMTSEQRAAVAVHYATQNRICLDAGAEGEICIACAEVADQIDAAVEVEHQAAEERGRRVGIEDRIWKCCLYPDTHPLLLPEEAPMPKCGKPLEAWGDGSWRCADGHFNSVDTLLREGLGRVVREVWVVWAHDQDKPKPHHLLPWEQISEDDKEVDRRIGETLLGIRDWRVGQTAKSRALAPRDSGKGG